MLRIQPSVPLLAKFCPLQASSKRSFKKLDKRPPDVFHYYLKLRSDRSNIPCEMNGLRRNIPFVKLIKQEWEALSKVEKRVYYALYFKSTYIDFRKLADEELARYLVLPVPVSTAYLLFRSKYKQQFNEYWDQQLRSTPKSSVQGNLVPHYRPLVRIASRSDSDINNMLNALRRYQEMCKACKRDWNERVTDEDKQELNAKIERAKANFHEEMTIERNELSLLTEVLEQSVTEDALRTIQHAPTSSLFKMKRVLDNGWPLPLPFYTPKKK